MNNYNSKILQVIYLLFRPFKSKLILLFFTMFAAGFFESLNLAALYPLINYGLDQPSQGVILKFFNLFLRYFDKNNLFLAACYLLAIITLIAVSAKALNYFISYRLMSRIVSFYQKEIMAKYINSDYGFFVKGQQGKLIYTGTVAAKQAGSMVLYSITTASDFLSLALMFSLLIMLTWQGTVAITLVGIFYFLVVKKVMNRIIYKYAHLLLEADREKNVILNEFLAGIKAIKAFMVFDAWKDKYDRVVDMSTKYQFKAMMGKVLPESLMLIVFYLMIAVSGIVITYKRGGNILVLVPVYGTFVLVASRLFPAIQKVGNDIMVLASALPNAINVLDLLREDTKKIPEGTKVLDSFRKEITFCDIWFKFENQDEFLFKGLEFAIEKDRVTAIVGPSGYGKTTLINLLLRLYEPEKGNITIDGVDIFEYDSASYLAKIGYVGQETFIYNDSIFENIKFGMDYCTMDAVVEAAKQANAHEFIVDTPNGYNTVVGDAGIRLSGGQRQRIAIARAMLRKPDIMVLDEATSSLDNISEKKVQEAINNISRYTTVVMIAHRLSTIQNADKILVLADGKIIEQGNHESLLGKRGSYYNLYNTQLTEKKA